MFIIYLFTLFFCCCCCCTFELYYLVGWLAFAYADKIFRRGGCHRICSTASEGEYNRHSFLMSQLYSHTSMSCLAVLVWLFW